MERILTLHFIDGTKLSLAFDEQGMNSAARKLKIEKLMASKHLVIEAEGTVMIFPIGSIKYMALSLPAPSTKGAREVLPSHAITGARIRS